MRALGGVLVEIAKAATVTDLPEDGKASAVLSPNNEGDTHTQRDDGDSSGLSGSREGGAGVRGEGERPAAVTPQTAGSTRPLAETSVVPCGSLKIGRSLFVSSIAFSAQTRSLAVLLCPEGPSWCRQQEIEEKLIEEETARRVEELVAKRVEEELEKRKDEIEREVLRRVEEAKRIMEKQLLEELERQRQAELAAQKAREEEERAKREELERILEENNRKIAEAQAKLAEEQLRIVEEQRKIHEERMKLEQERQRQQKEEQKIILGKGKSRPKLSFSLKTQD
ncbi:PREDICTED: arginine and glutamate-rich protein 1 [Condylura cristata]|uniref:arginine and glutamate-rich protein 1 n=1 Tax=Condylura cristata TaxID=143302 RepID=UPI0006432FD9|nr:PREDICTED: arginine and glutamate-rich protein 1 [Condylura cristata]